MLLRNKNIDRSINLQQFVHKDGNHQGFYIILQVISSQYEIHTDKCQKYILNVVKHFCKTKTASVHKLLIHEAYIIQHALLPVGQFSEKTQEARGQGFQEI